MTKQLNNDHPPLALGIAGYNYADLYSPTRLADLLTTFDESVKQHDDGLFTEMDAYRRCNGDGMKPEQVSELLVKMAPLVGAFVARLFNVDDVRQQQIAQIRREFDAIFVYRTEIASKTAAKFKGQTLDDWDVEGLHKQLLALVQVTGNQGLWETDAEMAASRTAVQILRSLEDVSLSASLKTALAAGSEATRFAEALSGDDHVVAENLLDIVRRWSFAATQNAELQQIVDKWVSFKNPEKRDFDNLVEHENLAENGYNVWAGHAEHHRRRDGFALTDKRYDQRQVLYEVDHCIYCHDRDTDSCSKGMRNKKDGTFKTNPLGVEVTGCPLEEKISEMHLVKRDGDNIAALALIIIDNPMCPGTGHRICNDCMKGCIYQKTEPVNIPQIETNVLTDVLFMPWGFEIYSLLTRWNPLNIKRPTALPYNGKNVLIAGMGPAGYTLSHYLLNEGFGVVGIDGLKIEPLDKTLTGDAETLPQPVYDFKDLYDDLDKRILLGFGGVAEYGITVRWDKNFLKVIYLNLLRRSAFRCYGGVRFGGTITVDQAWGMGFDHIAIASGAGKPTIIDIKNNLIRGVRKASDFLMALQLTGAAKASSLANLQVRLPAGVIGGGLTAIDTATELLAYYPVQVEKILHRYQILVAQYGEASVRSRYDAEELMILDEFLEHGQVIAAERQRAEAAGETPDFVPLVKQWGGVTMFYRKGIHDAPAYRQNHEEIHEALSEGIHLAEGMSPSEAFADQYGHLAAVRFERLTKQDDGKWVGNGETDVALRSLFVAAGTSPNTIYGSEFPKTFEMDKQFYKRHEVEWLDDEVRLLPITGWGAPKVAKPAPFTSYQRDGRYITFYGDNHPVYAGNVVKAMASAKDGYPYIVKLFANELVQLDPAQQAQRDAQLADFQQQLDEALLAQIVSVQRLTPTIIEVIVKAPQAAKNFNPGQFYRIQNFESLAPVVNGTALASEGIALTGAWVDKEQGLVSLIALEMGSSTRLCSTWKSGDKVVVMGVTGAPTEIPTGKTVLLLGGGLGNAVLFSIGKALRSAGNKVIYFAGYRNREDLFKVPDIEAASDLIVWAVDDRPGNEAIPVTRPQDKTFVGNIVEAMIAYGSGSLGETPILLSDVDHLVVIGSDRMMAAVKEARYGVLQPYLQEHEAIASINSPMQCMMKGVCAQCLCKHIDENTGEPYFVYSCYNQDQELDRVDFPNLNARLRQNTVQEKLSSLWLTHLLEESGS